MSTTTTPNADATAGPTLKDASAALEVIQAYFTAVNPQGRPQPWGRKMWDAVMDDDLRLAMFVAMADERDTNRIALADRMRLDKENEATIQLLTNTLRESREGGSGAAVATLKTANWKERQMVVLLDNVRTWRTVLISPFPTPSEVMLRG